MNGIGARAPVVSNSRAVSRSCCILTSIWTSANRRSPIVARCGPFLGNARVGSHRVRPVVLLVSWTTGSVVQRLDLGTIVILSVECDVTARASPAARVPLLFTSAIRRDALERAFQTFDNRRAAAMLVERDGSDGTDDSSRQALLPHR